MKMEMKFKKVNIFLGIIIILVVVVIIYLLYGNFKEGLYEIVPPVFNFGTREWIPTRLQSYDIRGDIPVSYSPIGIYNQPEYPNPTPLYNPNSGEFYYLEPNFYTYEYVNPLQGYVPPVFNKDLSVPYAVSGQGNNSNGVKPILN